MKKIGYIIINFLQLILLIGGFAIYYFTKKRMGMARYIIYKNQNIERDYPVEIIRYILLFTVFLFMILTIVLYVKNKNKISVPKTTIPITLAMVLFFLVFTVSQSKETIRTYYFIGLFTAIASILQIGKTLYIIKKERIL